MKTILIIFLEILLFTLPINSQSFLKKNQITSGKIVYFESGENISELNARYKYFSSAKRVLKDITTNSVVNVKDELTIDEDAKLISITFKDDLLKNLIDDDFSLFINDSLIASTSITDTNITDKTAADTTSPLIIDIKPSFDLSQPQELDVNYKRAIGKTNSRTSEGNAVLNAKGSFSTHPDSAALNSVQLNLNYSFTLGKIGVFKYFAISGQIGSEHPQDFSQTNLVGSVVLSTILPWTGILARYIANDYKDVSNGLLFQPAVEFVRKTTVKDSNYVRGAIHGYWSIPLLNKENIIFYGVVYFQDGFRPRSYSELTIDHNLSSSIAVIAKWVNGELPPLFQRESELRIGLRFQ